MEFSFNFPIAIEFGLGKSKRVGEIAKQKGWRKTVIITDAGLVKAGILNGVKESLESNNVSYIMFDKVVPNPTDISVEEAAEIVKELEADFLMGVGGGSSMDTAKGAALMATNPGDIRNYETNPVRNHLLPLVTIPTTAGTGSEVDFWAVITDTERKFKMALGQAPSYPGGPYLGAVASLVDPLLTRTLPSKLTASTGIDALSHAIETFTARDSTPIVAPLSLHSIKLIARWLPSAYADGEKIEARENMMFASMIAGICENYANCGATHSLAEALGGVYGTVPHGIAIGVFLPKVMGFNHLSVSEKYVEIAEAMGEDVHGISIYEASRKAIYAVEELLELLDMPSTLKEIEIKHEDLAGIASRAIKTVEVPGNPRNVTEKDLLDILEEVYG